MWRLDRSPVDGGWVSVWEVRPGAVAFAVRDRRGDNRTVEVPAGSSADCPGLAARVHVAAAFPDAHGCGWAAVWVEVVTPN